MSNNNYIIQGGEEGKKRLGVLSEILEASTRSLIQAQIALEGKRFLDVGSGGGHVSLMASELVGPHGHVTAIDFDNEITRLARLDAEAKNISNITYRTLDAYALDYHQDFDVAYARFLLSHLQHPEKVLHKMIQSVDTGGVIIVEDIDFSGHFCYPPSEAFTAYVNYYTTVSLNNGQHPHLGLSLQSMFKNQPQLKDIQFDVIQPCFNAGNGKWMAYHTLDKIKSTILRQGLATEDAMEQVLLDLKQFTESENSVISLPRIFRATAKKA
jgi:ubiquinone/menaquinone biosynthesis C-methylase UbiE